MKIPLIDSIGACGREMRKTHSFLLRNLINIEHLGSHSTNIAVVRVKMLTMSLELT